MNYTLVHPATAPNLPTDEVQVTLDTGHSVAAKALATRISGGSVNIRVEARQIDPETGETIKDANGDPIISTASHTFDAATIAAQTLPICGGELAAIVLGEPSKLFGETLPPLAGGVLASWSIRNAIAAAAHAGPMTNLASLL